MNNGEFIHMNENETFDYIYSAKQQEEIKNIRKKYLIEQENKIQQLKKLDQSASTPGIISSLFIGISGTLMLGTGMSCTMLWTDTLFFQGIFIGCIGIILIALAYPVYSYLTKKQRRKIAPKIIQLTDELLNK